MLKFLSLSSGSAGNCYFLSDGKSGLLIDAGVSVRRLKKTLMEHGLGPDSFQAVLVTHDHLDHIRHLGSYCKHLKKPVYATSVLHDALAHHTFTRNYISDFRCVLPEGEPFRINLGTGAEVDEFPVVSHFVVPHDATQTVGYFIEWSGVKFFLMTDAGRATDEAIEYARRSDAVVFESNYDTGMLIGGPYSHDLKMRICQGNGHLSNDECASAIRRFWHPGLRNLFLCHLSENNNTPSLAFEASAEALRSIPAGDGLTAKDITNLQTLPRTHASAMFTLTSI